MMVSNRSRTLATPTGQWVCSSCRHAAQLSHQSFSQLFSAKKARANVRVYPSKTTTRQNATAVNYKSYTDHKEYSHRSKEFRPGSNLPRYPARTRFAPSPTGYMHIGGLRTALYSYLLAKKTGGQFILRIEDTDSKRFVADAEQRLCEDLQWAGLQWDEGPQVGGEYGPYKQSERNDIYQEHAKQLINSKAAYRCFCTSTEVNVGQQAYSTGGCHQSCASLPAEQSEERAVDGKEKFTVRLLPPVYNPKSVFQDLVYGGVRRLKRSPSGSPSEDGEDGGSGLADPVLIKSDGVPTYHFANVVDDHLMRITHVIRGSEWLPSLPLHYDLYHAFDWKPPLFAHVGLLVDQQGAKLSKRSNNAFALDIPTLRDEQGIIPEALRNYLALLGWSNPGKHDVMSLSEMIAKFDLKFVRGNAIVAPDKLWYLQRNHVHRRCKLAQETGTLEPIQPLLDAIEAEILTLYSVSDLHTRGLPLKSYIAEVFLIDSKHFFTPKLYVSRVRYLFRFDRAQVPPPSPEAVDERIPLLGSSTTPEFFLSDLLLNFDFQQPYRTTRFAPNLPSNPEENPLKIPETRVHLIHAAISLSIYRSMLTQASLPIDEDVLGFSSVDHNLECQTQLAEYVAEQLGNGITGEEVFKQHKSWNKILMKYLREKLCYGLPGPGMGNVMAVLGWEEVCRRMELDVQEAGSGKGW